MPRTWSSLAALIVPCMLLIMVSSGQLFLGILIVGLLLSSILHESRLPEASLVVFWVFLVASICALFYTGITNHGVSLFVMFLLLNVSLFLISCGFLVSLFSPVLQEDFPNALVVLESAVFSTLCMPCTSILMCGLLPYVGADNSAFYLAFILFFAYKQTMSPIKSQFVPDAFVVDPIVAGLHAILVVLLPAAFYISLHYYASIFSRLGLANLVLLLAIPILLFVSPFSRQKPSMRPAASEPPTSSLLWWLGVSSETLDRHRFWVVCVTLWYLSMFVGP